MKNSNTLQHKDGLESVESLQHRHTVPEPFATSALLRILRGRGMRCEQAVLLAVACAVLRRLREGQVGVRELGVCGAWRGVRRGVVRHHRGRVEERRLEIRVRIQRRRDGGRESHADGGVCLRWPESGVDVVVVGWLWGGVVDEIEGLHVGSG